LKDLGRLFRPRTDHCFSHLDRAYMSVNTMNHSLRRLPPCLLPLSGALDSYLQRAARRFRVSLPGWF
jgi:hypothetical protein